MAYGVEAVEFYIAESGPANLAFCGDRLDALGKILENPPPDLLDAPIIMCPSFQILRLQGLALQAVQNNDIPSAIRHMPEDGIQALLKKQAHIFPNGADEQTVIYVIIIQRRSICIRS